MTENTGTPTDDECLDMMLKHPNTSKTEAEHYAGRRIVELELTIIDLKACLRTCANAAQGGLDQYK